MAPNDPPGEFVQGEFLQVEFCDDHRWVHQSETLTFGREAEIVIDTNPFLHRKVGLFRFVDGQWWLENLGSEIALSIFDSGSLSTAKVGPGRRVPLLFAHATVRFVAGQSSYEVTVVQGTDSSASLGVEISSETEITTLLLSNVTLNPEQRQLLVALARPWLEDRTRERPLATNAEIARQLNWTLSKFNRKLDNLCQKFERHGWSGLHGETAFLATERRRSLVRAALDSRLITDADLESPEP
jgi:hypothetical protein